MAQLNVRFTEYQEQRLDRIAAFLGSTRSDVVRQVIFHGLPILEAMYGLADKPTQDQTPPSGVD